MGCDYYIIKRLKIEHSSGVDFIELDRERCYFPENDINNDILNYDSDDTDADISLSKYYERYLKVTFVPRIIYTDYEWKNEKVEQKYIDMVYEKLKHYNNAFSNIYQITKEEVRNFR
jgi:hypothetical protein